MSDTILYVLFVLAASFMGLFLVLYAYFKYSFTYWKRKGVVYPEPSFPFGNLTDALLMKKSGGVVFKELYDLFEGRKFVGAFSFGKPMLVLRDPELIKTTLVKDFNHFQDHGIYYNEETDPLSAHLFSITGTRWKNLRVKLTPTFTSGKMKMMFQTLVDCGEGLKTHVLDSAQKGLNLEMKDILAKYSTDVIASCAFGIQCNCLQNPDAEFRAWGRKIFKTSTTTAIRDILMFVSPRLAAILDIPFVPKDVSQYFLSMVKETVNYRENNNTTRNDFMQMLIQLKNQELGKDDQKQMNGKACQQNGDRAIRNLNDLAAQVFVFFVAGFETTSTTMSFCLYELALNPDIQVRVQEEIDSVLKKHNNKISYECVQEMVYLDKVISGKLITNNYYLSSRVVRKKQVKASSQWLPFLTRVCTKEYEIPETDIVVEEGTSVIIPIMGLQNDPKYFPNPSKFDPDRFSDEHKNKRHNFSFLPFGEGPRVCIGKYLRHQAVYFYFQRAFKYWEKKKAPFIKPSFPFGNFADSVLLKQSVGELFSSYYKDLEGEKFAGTFMFTNPGIVFLDPDLIKHVLVKDFSYFHDRGLHFNEEKEPLSANLFLLPGTRWRQLRVKLSPTFSSGKMKMMFQILVDCGVELGNLIEKMTIDGKMIDFKDVLARFGTDVISSCAFGIQCNSLTNPDAEFREWGKKVFEPSFKNAIHGILRAYVPKVMEYIDIPPIDRQVSKYFQQMVKETVEYREKNNVVRNDFMQLLIQLKNKGFVAPDHQEGPTKGEETDTTTGFETSSSTTTFALYELALHQDIQDRLRDEITTVIKKHDGKITYDCVQDMTYLDQVVSETLRKYPPLTILNREVTKEYTIPGTDVVVEKGTPALIPVKAIHHDPKYYPNPDKFDPDRFSEEEKQKRHPYVYLPFGEGPRICIGMRFGLMQSKVGLVSLLSKFKIDVGEKTPIPLKMNKKSFIMQPIGGMWLKITKLLKMAFIFETLLLDVGALVACLLLGVYFYFQRAFKYWEKKKAPFIKPSFPFGTFRDSVILRKPVGEMFASCYKKLEGERFGGTFMFTNPGVIFRDPELIKNVLVKDFAHFHDRGFRINEEREPLTGHLFFLPGTRWRNLRVKLSPTFTSGKMKMMFQTLVDCGVELGSLVENMTSEGQIIEIKDVLARYSTDIISSCAFGIQCNSLKDPNAEFRQWGRKIFEPSIKGTINGLLRATVPKLMKYIDVKQIDEHVSKYFLEMVKDTVEYREKNDIKRNDFMQLLIQLKKNGFVAPDHQTNGHTNNEIIDKSKLSIDSLAAQAFVFFAAGFETSSTTMTFCLYELSLQHDIQEKVREEIRTVLKKYDGKITYDCIQEMTYLDQVVSEEIYTSIGLNYISFVIKRIFPNYSVLKTQLFSLIHDKIIPRAFTYWEKKKVPFIKPSFPFGTFRDSILLRKQIGDMFRSYYTELEGERFGGTYMFTNPGIVFRDPELIKNVLVKDFAHFHDRGFHMDEEKEPLSGHLFLLPGTRWRNLRVKLSPTFTSGKMKMMFQTLVDCGVELGGLVENMTSEGQIIEIKDVLARYSTDIISSCAFGIQCNSLKNPNAEFRQWGRKIFEPSIKSGIGGLIRATFPKILDYIDIPGVDKNISKYFQQMVKDTVEYREKNNVIRNDFMQLLIQLKNKGFVAPDHQNGSTKAEITDTSKLSMGSLAAQAFVFFIAGFETSSTTMTFCLYELSLNHDVQEKLREEIRTVLKKHDGKITYDCIQEMTYLDQVVSETLRKYPPVPILNREVTKEYTVPGTDVILKQGTPTVIPILAIQHDPKHFPNPEKFDPDRFTEEEKQKRHPYVYIPFGEGPRICIGLRFGMMQTKIGIVSLLSKFKFDASEKTPIPLKMDNRSFIMAPIGGMWLKITKC
ncbi:hypothetical protein C0J52_18964 [Blattella germanica]|nr:hypothetical protein C0J52_18964 [Blattella germanica]